MFGWGLVTDIYLRSISKKKRRKFDEFACPICGELVGCDECNMTAEFREIFPEAAQGHRCIAEFPCPRCGELKLCAECDRMRDFLPAPIQTERAREGR